MKRALSLWIGGLALVAMGTVGTAQIEQLTLRQMVQKTDDVVMGTIKGREVIRIDHPTDGPELYYTFLTVEGQSMLDGEPVVVEVAYPGGFIDDEHGVFNSEAPSEDDVRTGNRVVVFYKWIDNMGGDLAANALYCSHGGLYRTYQYQQKVVVQGRGEGYAIDNNLDSEVLGQRVRLHRKQ